MRRVPVDGGYRRSDGSHQYVVGNTLSTSFLSETYLEGRPNGSNIAADVRGSAEYLGKIRFSPIGDLYPHPAAAPFLDNSGRLTSNGNDSHRPNPEWFRNRTDRAVGVAFEHDLVADLIMSGVDTEAARSALRPAHNNSDPEPFLRYLAARSARIRTCGCRSSTSTTFGRRRTGPTRSSRSPASCGSISRTRRPVSVHRAAGPWVTKLNTTPAWNDRVIIQEKLRDLGESADAIVAGHTAGGGDKPVVNDELSYQGEGDRHSRDDTVESHLGAFLGGGYRTTGYKSANKLGQSFAGRFDAAEHTAAPHLNWLRERIDARVSFWKMTPVALERSIFTGGRPGFRALEWPERECSSLAPMKNRMESWPRFQPDNGRCDASMC